MERGTLNIAKAYDDGFIEVIEKNNYFLLHMNAATSTGLYCFAIALAEKVCKDPTPVSTVGVCKSIVRTELLANVKPLLSCLYYEKVLKEHPDQIDVICNRDEVYNLAKKCANTDFVILKYWTDYLDEETMFHKLIGYMGKKCEEIKVELGEML